MAAASLSLHRDGRTKTGLPTKTKKATEFHLKRPQIDCEDAVRASLDALKPD
jgi:hypothetical protein